MDIEIICNTEDEELFRNVRTNTSAPLRWVKQSAAHDGHAIIVGGGPSLVDTLPLLKRRHALGQKIFALNGASKFLNEHGIIPEYQVILDARPQTVAVRGKAREYLIASQCHPKVFAGLKNVTMWHPAIPGIDGVLPDYDDEFSLIGGGTSVGLSAMCLVYTMGYRKLHLFGYDSSGRDGAHHAYRQPINDTELKCKVTVKGNSYRTTLTMARQAELFPECCNNLIDLGCIITVDGDGLIMEAVRHMHAKPLSEVEKYRKAWESPLYRVVSPGERIAEIFVKVADIKETTRVIDFGCGSGRGAKAINEIAGCPVHQVDFADNCRDDDNDLPFTVADMTEPMSLFGDVGFCTDVMEHIPPPDVPAVIANIMACVDSCFFQIALFHDNCGGALIGQDLHLSVFPVEWWVRMFDAFEIVNFDHATHPIFPYLTLYVRNFQPKERN